MGPWHPIHFLGSVLCNQAHALVQYGTVPCPVEEKSLPGPKMHVFQMGFCTLYISGAFSEKKKGESASPPPRWLTTSLTFQVTNH